MPIASDYCSTACALEAPNQRYSSCQRTHFPTYNFTSTCNENNTRVHTLDRKNTIHRQTGTTDYAFDTESMPVLDR